MISDTDVLDCEVCMEALSPPIYQCTNGHYACSVCVENMKHKCHACKSPIDKSIRNLGLEKILGSLKRKCEFSSEGCKKMPAYLDVVMHERSCWYRPHACPLSRCSFRGNLLNMTSHFTASHDVRTITTSQDTTFVIRILPHEEYVAVWTSLEIFLFCCHDCHEVGKILYISSFCFNSLPSSSSLSSVKNDTKTPLAPTYTLSFLTLDENKSLTMSLKGTIKKYQQSCNDVAGLIARDVDFLLIPKPYFSMVFVLSATISSITKP